MSPTEPKTTPAPAPSYATQPLAPRRASRRIHLGPVAVGGGAPISVQSMTNTPTTDVAATSAQIRALAAAGAEIVRVSCPDADSTAAFARLAAASPVPLVADIHFHYKRAIEAAEAGAACLRFNPGNIGDKERVREVVRAARDHGCAIRIGVNAGSLERDLLEEHGRPTAEALAASALRHAALLEEADFRDYKISAKASDVALTVAACRLLAAKTDAPLHLGVTEAGSRETGALRSAVGLGLLLGEGIGDTIRVSLAADPVHEVRAGAAILKSLGLRASGLSLVACPGCARQQFDVARVAERLEERLEALAAARRLADARTGEAEGPGAAEAGRTGPDGAGEGGGADSPASLKVSVIGCVVNGPGEALASDIGLAGGGKGVHQLYLRGKPLARFRIPEGAGAMSGGASDALVEELASLVERELGPQ